MTEELQGKLFQKYPKLFRQKDLSLQESAMPRGIETENGWYWLLDKLCECIQLCVDRNKLEQVEFTQVKEKLGKLCIYTNYDNETINGMIWMAGHLSRYICQHCGSVDNVEQTKGCCITYLCDKCKGSKRQT